MKVRDLCLEGGGRLLLSSVCIRISNRAGSRGGGAGGAMGSELSSSLSVRSRVSLGGEPSGRRNTSEQNSSG